MSLSESTKDALRDRGFKDRHFNTGKNLIHWMNVAKQPLAFFHPVKKTILQGECTRRNIPWKLSDTIEILRDKLLESESVYFRVMIVDGWASELRVLTARTTIIDLLDALNRHSSINVIFDVTSRVYSHVMCDNLIVDPSTTIGTIAAQWQSRKTGIEKYIIALEVY